MNKLRVISMREKDVIYVAHLFALRLHGHGGGRGSRHGTSCLVAARAPIPMSWRNEQSRRGRDAVTASTERPPCLLIGRSNWDEAQKS